MAEEAAFPCRRCGLVMGRYGSFQEGLRWEVTDASGIGGSSWELIKMMLRMCRQSLRLEPNDKFTDGLHAISQGKSLCPEFIVWND